MTDLIRDIRHSLRLLWKERGFTLTVVFTLAVCVGANATIYSALGIDWTTIRRDDPLGRGFEYVPFADRDQYGPVHELWG